ncbi:MAG: ribosome recycling factor, partial [Desulfomonilaceae bacterium]
MLEDALNELKSAMDKSVEALKKDLKRIRTGRASLALLDGITPNYYGTPTPLNQLATLSIPEPRQIAIQ